MIRKMLGAVFLGALFAGLLAPLANAQTHLSATQVSDIVTENNAHNFPVPQAFIEAWVSGVGITYDDLGSFVVDPSPYSTGDTYDYSGFDYNDVSNNTGDPALAAVAASGLLSQAQLRQARGQYPLPGDPYNPLNGWYGVNGYIFGEPGGGGGGQNLN